MATSVAISLIRPKFDNKLKLLFLLLLIWLTVSLWHCFSADSWPGRFLGLSKVNRGDELGLVDSLSKLIRSLTEAAVGLGNNKGLVNSNRAVEGSEVDAEVGGVTELN